MTTYEKNLFTNNELGFEREFTVKIKNISHYENFHTYLEGEGLEHKIKEFLTFYAEHISQISSCLFESS